VLVGLEAGSGRSRARGKNPTALVRRAGHCVLALGRQPQGSRLVTTNRGPHAEQLAELRRRLGNLLEVVEHERHSLRADVAGQLLARAERRADRRTDRSGSRTACSGTHQTPCSKSSTTSAAACTASLVFPEPPEPVSVSKRVVGAPRSASTSPSSFSRPTNGVGCTGRFDWLSDLSGGNSLSPSW
jgi:hypothetical protein